MVKKCNLHKKGIVPNLTSAKNISSSRKEHLNKKQKKETLISRTPELAISLMIHTASMDHFLKNQGIDSYFESLTHCLSKQNFKKFELVYVDTFYENNKDKFSKIINCLPFQVKHVDIHKQHRYWYDRGNTYISAAKNTGILYADGELCITCDDAEFFPDNFLNLYWKEYKQGRLLIALHKRLKKINSYKGKALTPISGEEYINDSRFTLLKSINYKIHNSGSLAFAGTSFSLNDALLLNGFNEKMDGCKSLEDCDFGVRLSLIGKTFSMTKDGFLYILEHQSYNEAAHESINNKPEIDSPYQSVETRKKISNFIAIENYGMLQCSQKLLDVKANKTTITNRHIEIIKQETLKYRGFDPTDSDHIDNFNVWLSCPNFDLEQQRIELRNSEEWKWKKHLKQ